MSVEDKKFGRYRIVRELGQGAMGVVYEALDPNLDRRVAIKTVLVNAMSQEAAADFERRFRTEARSAGRLQHPHIVSVYDAGRDANTAFLVMEFVPGHDLKHRMDSGTRFTLAQSVGIVLDLLSALAYAHANSVIHRDVKPANLLLDEQGRVKLADFGVARIQDSGELTQSQMGLVGTLKYSAPEQIKGLPLDHRVDLFATGVVLYQLLTGQRPFDGSSYFEISQQIVHEHPRAPSSINLALPAALDQVMAKALAKSADERFQNAGEFAQALQSASALAADAAVLAPIWPSAHMGSSVTSPPLARDDSSPTPTLVTQELDLVFWKDVKDSTDAPDFISYLNRFPQGVYADLARRRLQKLMPQDGDTQVVTRAPDPRPNADGFSALTSQSWAGDATIKMPPPLATDIPLQPAPASPPAATHNEAPFDPTWSQAPQPDPASAEPTATASQAGGPAKRGLWLGLAGLMIVVVAASYVGMRPAPLETAPDQSVGATTAAPEKPTKATDPAAPAALPADKAAELVKAVVAASATAPAAASASATKARLAAKAARAKTESKAKGDDLGAAAVPSPQPPPTQPSTATNSSAPKARPGSPADACEDRILLGYQLCMGRECAKPQFYSHGICVERRAMEKNSQEQLNRAGN